jgi:F-type H+-transporting ATPase subunit c
MYTLLGIALVETAVIYAFVIAMMILWKDDITLAQAIGAGLAMWLTAFGAGYGEGKMVASAMESVNRNPDNKKQVLQFMFLFLALVETVAVYGLIISYTILS